MAVIRTYEDGRAVIQVKEDESGFSFAFSCDLDGPEIFMPNLEEELAIKIFNNCVRSYLTIVDKEADAKVTFSILAHFGIHPK